MKIGDAIQSADWKNEKHVPAIEAPDVVKAGEPFKVKVSVGKEISHPNTTAHHIAWISVFFKPEGDKFLYPVGRFDFGGHGPVYTNPSVKLSVTIDKPGTLVAVEQCNIHGLWEGSKDIAVG